MAENKDEEKSGCAAQLGGLLIVGVLIGVIVHIGQWAGCIDKQQPPCAQNEATCDQAREQCLARATEDKNDCLLDCETSAGSNIAMLRCAKRCNSTAWDDSAHCIQWYQWREPPPAKND